VTAPDGILVNGEQRRLDCETLAALLTAERIDPTARGVAVAVNGAVVPRRQWAEARLAAGDRVEIVKPFSGG